MKIKKQKYDIIVVGGGHAGYEATLAAAKMGVKVLLITTTIKKIATMPCNPAIGGPGKGHLVREIDALGGVMGKITDLSLIQIRLLNNSKGPAVQALRAQIERENYKKLIIENLKKQKNLDLLEDEVIEIQNTKDKKQNKVYGIITKSGRKIRCRALIISTGTFLNGKIIIGNKIIRKGGRIDEDSSLKLSESLKKLGLKLEKLQTATPPRIAKNSVNFSKMEIQPGTSGACSFSFPEREVIKYKNQIPCWLTYTNKKTHLIIHQNLKYSPIKSGIILEHGPRHCPSIDRKIVNFPKKERHPIFVEPEGRKSQRLYLQGLTTAMPEKIQLKIIRSIEGLEKAEIVQPGYAVVYDFLPPWQIKNTLETKKISGLFLAGQINGTSGYEEAAAQGLIAGINAALFVKSKSPFSLKRNEAYIGVLIDDLITKEHQEPYRVYTASAEYRLLLRQGNADARLTDYGFKLGLQKNKRKQEVEKKQRKIKKVSEELKKINLRSLNSWKYLKRPGISIKDLLKLLIKNKVYLKTKKLEEEILKEIEIRAKYEDYIERQKKEVRKSFGLESRKIPKINYNLIQSLRNSAKERLKEVEPETLGQASRIAGVTPADVSALLIYLEKEKRLKALA